MKKSFFALLFSGLLLFTGSCVKNPVTGKRDFMLLSKDKEIAMGRQSDPEIVQYFGLYEDARLQKFINEKGKEMAAISHRKDLPYEFKVVDSPVVNAFAVPGGFVYFTRGIMAHFNNEAEFAGVLGHEIGHITARHSAKQYSKTMLAQVGLVAGMVISPEFAQFSGVAEQGVGMLFLKHGRDAERQSDALGVEYSTKIGYDAREMAGFFHTLDRLSGPKGERAPEFLSSHPHPENRLANVQQLSEKWQQELKVKNLQVNRNEYLRLIDGLVYGEDPKQGFVEKGVFYHPSLAFQFPVPSQWAVENTSNQVQMVPKNGNGIMIMKLAAGSSLTTAAEEMLKNYDLTLVETKELKVNGLSAISMLADQQQEPAEKSLRTLSYLISYNNRIYTFIGASAKNDFNSLSSVFTNTMGNFQALTQAEMLNRKPERVRVKSVKQNATLAEALRSYQVQENRLEEMAVLNGMQLSDRVSQGMLFKVIER